MNGFALLAALTVFVHVAFVIFAAAGGVIVLRWPRVAWLHLPAVAWAVFVELSGGFCPLTPLENEFRERGGLQPYSGDFVANYVLPVLYPEGLTRDVQIWIGLGVLAINVAAYAWMMRRRVQRKSPPLSRRA